MARKSQPDRPAPLPPEVVIINPPPGPEADAALRRYWATAWRLAALDLAERQAREAAPTQGAAT